MKTAFKDRKIEAIFQQYSGKSHQHMMRLRQLVFDVADATDEVGNITEALRWGEPAYLTQQSKSGSSIRINVPKSDRDSDNPGQIAMYFQCQTTLVGDFRSQFGDKLQFEGNRAIILSTSRKLPEAALRSCIKQALTYHSSKRKKTNHTKKRRTMAP